MKRTTALVLLLSLSLQPGTAGVLALFETSVGNGSTVRFLDTAPVPACIYRVRVDY